MFSMERRAKNYTNFEKQLLVDLVLEEKNVVQNKKTDASSNEAKVQAWKRICSKFNSSQQSGVRNTKQLKELYQTIKRNARKNNEEKVT